jgi:hypothetical protein
LPLAFAPIYGGTTRLGAEFSPISRSHLLALGSWAINSVRTHLNISLIHHAGKCVGGGLVLGHLLLGGRQLVLEVLEVLQLLVDGVLLDDQIELVIFDLLFRAAPLTADFHQKTAGASLLYIKKKDESRWR